MQKLQVRVLGPMGRKGATIQFTLNLDRTTGKTHRQTVMVAGLLLNEGRLLIIFIEMRFKLTCRAPFRWH